MTLCKHIILLLTLMITLCSCQFSKMSMDIYEQIYEKYKYIDSYEGLINLTVVSNKTTREYKMSQYYKYPDNYRVDILEPQGTKGLVVINKGTDVLIVYPEIKGKFTLADYTPIEKTYTFLPDFFASYYKSEQTSVVSVSEANNKYTQLQTDIPGGGIYRHSQRLSIDNATLLPVKMAVFDINGKAVIIIDFDDVKINTEVNDTTFEVGGWQ